MDAITGTLPTQPQAHAVSRRATLRGLSGAAVAAALAIGFTGRAGASGAHRVATGAFSPASDDPAALIEAYVAAVNAGDLEGILALHDENAVHIMLPTADGSPGVCRGKGEFRMWYEQSVANGDRIEIADGSLAVDGNQAVFALRIASDPWRQLGLETLEANAEVVLIDGRIMTHVVGLTPDSVRALQTARGTAQATVPNVARGAF
jgi:hypothetical protein